METVAVFTWPSRRIVSAVAAWLERNVTGDVEILSGRVLCSKLIPAVSIEDFLLRCSSVVDRESDSIERVSVWVMTLSLIRKMTDKIAGFQLTPRTVHKTTLVCLVLASKFVIDVAPLSGHFSHATRLVPLSELREMEKFLLTAFDFRLWISPLEFHSSLTALIASSATDDVPPPSSCTTPTALIEGGVGSPLSSVCS